jgi:hypothetical protein
VFQLVADRSADEGDLASNERQRTATNGGPSSPPCHPSAPTSHCPGPGTRSA